MAVFASNAFHQPEPTVELDRYFTRRSIELGERARGHTGDNPHVGSVIVLGERILGEGWTSEPGRHHAEVNALLAATTAGHDVRGATLYSTLEPCSFVGRTPACALTIAVAGIRRVVFGIRDPHPRVDERGAELLRLAGLEVSEGEHTVEVRASLAEWLRGHRRL